MFCMLGFSFTLENIDTGIEPATRAEKSHETLWTEKQQHVDFFHFFDKAGILLYTTVLPMYWITTIQNANDILFHF